VSRTAARPARTASRYAASPSRCATLTAITDTSTILALTAIADAAGWQHVAAVADVLAIWPEIDYVVLIGAVLALALATVQEPHRAAARGCGNWARSPRSTRRSPRSDSPPRHPVPATVRRGDPVSSP
jgi:hypothetical protein